MEQSLFTSHPKGCLWTLMSADNVTGVMRPLHLWSPIRRGKQHRRPIRSQHDEHNSVLKPAFRHHCLEWCVFSLICCCFCVLLLPQLNPSLSLSKLRGSSQMMTHSILYLITLHPSGTIITHKPCWASLIQSTLWSLYLLGRLSRFPPPSPFGS